MKYITEIANEAEKAKGILLAKKVESRFCQFSAAAEELPKKIWAPSQAMTKFQMEQALGDWAEALVARAINRSKDHKAIAFGDNDKILSQATGFAEIYRAGKIREFQFGKRSDLLLFPAKAITPEEATSLNGEEAEKLCSSCIAALEVRSSRTSAHRFIEYRKKQRDLGKKPEKMEPSFTVKAEDLGKVYRWIARNKKPLLYLQVFFDSVFALNFIEVFRFINQKGNKLKLENPQRSGKFTIMIPISFGRQVGEVIAPSCFEPVHEQHEDGRHDIYAKPRNGDAIIKIENLISEIG